ncbi:MAG: CoA transferase [Caldilineae bacterium]|nr:MAG: CoA transferase [Caldilineae bacterium]
MHPSPLSHITVVSVEQAIAAPFATRHLADLGARVIKVERPGGDFNRWHDTAARGLCSHFVWVNRSKESICLDLKTPAGKEALEKLVARADVFVQNLAPGAVERLGFAADRLHREYPRLIICNISGYGPDGPYRDKKAYDLLIQGEAGVVSVTGTEEEPAKAGIPVADIAGGMYAFSAILTALYSRERTGEGAVIDVSLFDGLCEWMGFPAYYALGAARLPRAGASHAAIAPYGPFPTGDGRTVLLSIQNQREWNRFCSQVLERPEVATDPRFATNEQRVANRPALHAIIQEVFGQLTLEQAVDRLEAARIANGELRDVREFWRHPQLTERGRITQVESAVGPLPALLPAVNIQGVQPRMDPIPDVGAHTEAILREIGDSTAKTPDEHA